MTEELKALLIDQFTAAGQDGTVALMQEITDWMHKTVSPMKGQPIGNVRWIPVEKVRSNDYNPNSVATREMSLLYTSILHDGYTQPIVVVYDPETDSYVIVDGFHRYTTMRRNADIKERCHGYLPVVVLDKSMNDRMASTVRHNRARGKHSVGGMGNMVFEMLENGWADDQICAELGMEAEELVRLKHITGFSKLFDNVEYRKAWETKNQLAIKKAWKAEHPDEELV
jgi:ParB-like chromosome segregation protein Spo0J